MSLACLAHVNFFAAHLLFDVITEQINDDDDENTHSLV